MFDARMVRLAAGTLAVTFILGFANSAAVAGEWSEWYRYSSEGPINVFFKTKVSKDEIRVAWKCENWHRSQTFSCSVGAGLDKEYRCLRGGVFVGNTGALGERATVKAGGEYVFPSDWACRGLSADSVQPTVKIAAQEQ